MCRPALALLLVGLPVAALAQSTPTTPPDEAGDTVELDRDVGPLKDRIPPVVRHVFLLKERWELVPSVAFSFRDPFFTKYVFQLSLTYNFNDTLGAMVRAGYAAHTVSGSAQICTVTVTETSGTRGCRSPTYDEVNGKGTGQITFLGALDVQWTPIYGKFNLFGEWVLHFDLYGILGPAFISYKGPPATGQTGSASDFTVGGEVGIGVRFFFNKWITLRLEVRDDIYGEKSPTPSGGTAVQNQLFIDVGIGFFFPTSFHDG